MPGVLLKVNPQAIVANGFEDAMIGYTVNDHHPKVAVYDVDKCIEILVGRDGASYEEADEHLFSNVLCAFAGENGPLFVRLLAREEEVAS